MFTLSIYIESTDSMITCIVVRCVSLTELCSKLKAGQEYKCCH